MKKKYSVPAAPGQAERYDYEYRRNGMANLFRMFIPLLGTRFVTVTERGTAKDFAEVIRERVEEFTPDPRQTLPGAA